MNWWHPYKIEQKRENLVLRARMIKAIREHFDAQDFIEVQTPCLQVSPGLEPHLHAFKTRQVLPDMSDGATLYLHASPEFSMKKLLVSGLECIYQICPVFRNAEGSSLHSCEFTMIEWYRANRTYDVVMKDCEDLLRSVANACSVQKYAYGDVVCDPYEEWEYISVVDAFQKYVEIDLISVLDDKVSFAMAGNISFEGDYDWDDVFFKIFGERIEPKLGVGQPTILFDYPAHMAALSREKKSDPRFAERFELYVCGIELANAFGELTDADEQLCRFEHDQKVKKALYGESYPVDDDFIDALRHGMPEASGIALGIDRLAMLAAHADNIDDVLWCGKI